MSAFCRAMLYLSILLGGLPAAAEEPATELEPLQIEGTQPSLTQPGIEAADASLKRIPGGTNLVDLSEPTGRAATLDDALGLQPGVVVQEFFGGDDQPRLNIRGSGLQSNPQSRGVRLLRDGLPLNLADGSYVIGIVAPQTARHMEVYRGSNAVRYGGTTLGGAINLVAPTGRSDDGASLDVATGSFGERMVQAAYGAAKGDTDFYGTGIFRTQDGFREHNDGRRGILSLNAGHRFNSNAETRFYFDYTDLHFDIPGPLNRAQLRRDPSQVNRGIQPPPPGPLTGSSSVGPNVTRDRPWRDSEFVRVANRSTLMTGSGEWTAGFYYQGGDDVFGSPSTARDSDSDDFGVQLTYTTADDVLPGQLEIGAHAVYGTIDRRYFANERGTPGREFARNDLTAADTVAYGRYELPITSKLTATAAVQGVYALRDIDEAFANPGSRPRFNAATGSYSTFAAGSVNQRRTYTTLNGRLGLLAEITPQIQAFANISQSYEPPTFLELLQPAGNNANLGPNAFGAVPLDAQRAVTVEIGSRGQFKRLNWDATYYHSRVENELLTSAAFFGGVGVTSNYEDTTRHQGLELGLNLLAGKDIAASGDRLRLNSVYDYSDFEFLGGAFGGNQIAGVPRHRLQTELIYEHPQGFYAGPNVLWLPDDTPTDHANTVFQDSYALLGFRAGFRPNNGPLSIFVEGRNLTDRKYAASYLVRTRVPNPGPPNAGPEQVTSFIPGTERSFTAGIRLSW